MEYTENIDCVDCINCRGCQYCTECKDCTECEYCMKCANVLNGNNLCAIQFFHPTDCKGLTQKQAETLRKQSDAMLKNNLFIEKINNYNNELELRAAKLRGE